MKTKLEYLCEFLAGKNPDVPEEMLEDVGAPECEIRDFFAGGKIVSEGVLDLVMDEPEPQDRLVAKLFRQALARLTNPYNRDNNRGEIDALYQRLFGPVPLDGEEYLYFLEAVGHQLLRLGAEGAHRQLQPDTLRDVASGKTTVEGLQAQPNEILARNKTLAQIASDDPMEGLMVMLYRLCGRSFEEIAQLLNVDLEEVKKNVKIADDEIMHAGV